MSAYDNDPRVRANDDGSFTLPDPIDGDWTVRKPYGWHWVAEGPDGEPPTPGPDVFDTADEAIAAIIGEPGR